MERLVIEPEAHYTVFHYALLFSPHLCVFVFCAYDETVCVCEVQRVSFSLCSSLAVTTDCLMRSDSWQCIELCVCV